MHKSRIYKVPNAFLLAAMGGGIGRLINEDVILRRTGIRVKELFILLLPRRGCAIVLGGKKFREM